MKKFLEPLLIALVFQVALMATWAEFVGFEAVVWESTEVEVELPGPEQRGVVYGKGGEKLRLRSSLLEIGAEVLELSLAGNVDGPLGVELRGEDDAVLFRGAIDSRDLLPSLWRLKRVQLPKGLVGQKASITVLESEQQTTERWVASRNRVNFFRSCGITDSQLTESQRIVQTEPFKYFSVLLIATALAVALLWRNSFELSPKALFLVFFALSIGVHLRFDTFFYWDEWHVLQRYSELGIGGTIYRHNEHFLPLFFLSYYLEALLFGDKYTLFLLLGLAVHAVNAVLLTRLLTRIIENSAYARKAGLIIGSIFLLSALHGETLHWAFELSVLLSQTMTLIALHCGLSYIQSGRPTNFPATVACIAAAPLFFGNGFFSGPILAIVLMLAAMPMLVSKELPLKRLSLRLAFLLLLAAGGACAAFLLYTLNIDGQGHDFSGTNPLSNPKALINYLYVGAQLGSVLRGLGLFLSLELDAANKFLPIEFSPFGAPELVFAHAGAAVSILLLALALFPPKESGISRTQGLCLWVSGQLILFGAFLLPGLARWQHGYMQALSLRYQYAAFIGLAIVLLPAINNALAIVKEPKNYLSKVTKISLTILLIAHFSVQLQLGMSFNYFRDNGRKNRAYLAKLSNWNKTLKTEGERVAYEGTGTAFQGLYPLQPPTVTPGRHPDAIYKTLRWLNPSDNPLR